MKSLKYEGVVKLKIFWSLKRLEAGLSGFKIKRVHYGKFGLQIIIYHPYYTKPNKALSSLITPKPDLHPPWLSKPFALLLPPPSSSFFSSDRRRRQPRATAATAVLPHFSPQPHPKLVSLSLPCVLLPLPPSFLLRPATINGGEAIFGDGGLESDVKHRIQAPVSLSYLFSLLFLSLCDISYERPSLGLWWLMNF